MAKRNRQNDSVIIEDCDDEERYFLNPDSVSPHLFCSICQEVFVEPQRAPCGHSFCKKCILQWLKQSQTCPEDRQHLKRQNLHHDFILENIIGDQMVACPFRKAGCVFVGQLERSAAHKRTCAFNPSNLPDFLQKDSAELRASSGPLAAQESNLEAESLPTPGKPSLKMRLFQAGDSRRNLLCSMFEGNKENARRSQSQS